MTSPAFCWIILAGSAAILSVSCNEITLPANFTALSGNLRVGVNLSSAQDAVRIQLVRMTDVALLVLGSTPVRRDEQETTLPCKLISQGGRYGLRLVRDNDTNPGDLTDLAQLDVRWPTAKVTLDTEHVVTYPNQSVTATLQFPDSRCRYLASAGVPEFLLELLYCGHSPVGCADANATIRQVLSTETVRGYPKRRQIALGCELFGLDGYYAVTLRPASPTQVPLNATATLKASWSDKFVFNVYARSIFPCSPHNGGVETVFQYPSCRLPLAGDRVRLFARLRADVTSMQPPTSLHYVAEQRVNRDQHHLHFDCDLFSEKFVEYCFVYVSQAVTGAMADVRMDCVPTLPVAESDSGGWGGWSSWTTCTTTCPGGTRSRYRFCDTPPPRYGAKFCEGERVETVPCGGDGDVWDCPFDPSSPVPADRPEVLAEVGERVETVPCGGDGDVWDCPFDPSSPVPADRPEVLAEVGPGCRCGCVVHLGVVKPRRLLAMSALSCPGRALWLLQAEPGHVVRVSVEHLRLPCSAQTLKLRDGDSLAAQLLAQLGGEMRGPPKMATSTDNNLLMEYFSEDGTCSGGFVAHAQQIPPQSGNWSEEAMTVSRAIYARLSLVHVSVLLFVCAMFLTTACLAVQYLVRHRKYNLAVTNMTSHCTSRATLLSDVIELARGVATPASRRHVTLREEAEEEEEEEEEENEYETVECYTDHRESRVDLESSARDTSASETDVVKPNIGLITGKPKKMSKKVEVRVLDDDKDANSRPTSSTSSRRLSIARTLSIAASSASSASSVATLTNGRAGVNGVTAKEGKDKRNLERLLRGATSEFSLGGPDASDLELDYYDYNVSNAGAVPGSFLGMDPAYLVWIPPFAPGCWDTDDDLLNLGDSSSVEHEMQEFSARSQHSPDAQQQVTQLHDAGSVDKVVDTPPARARHGLEKETRVEKSPGGDVEYYDLLNEIKFADDEEDDATVDSGGENKKMPSRRTSSNKSTPHKTRHIRA